MARLFTAGFETGSTEWNGASSGGVVAPAVVSTQKRTGTYSCKFGFSVSSTSYFRQVFEAGETELYGRLAIYVTSSASAYDFRIVDFRDTNNNRQVEIRYVAGTQTLNIYNGAGTLLALGNVLVPVATWIMCEWHLVVGSSGSLTVKINATTDAVFSGDTDYTNDGYVRSIYFGAQQSATAGASLYEVYLDDIAVNDTDGSYENSWPGLGGIFWLEPTADGDQIDWTPSSGTVNYAMVDDIPPDNATTFNQALASGSIDLYEVGDCPEYIAQVNLVQVAYRAALVTSGYNETTDLVKVDGTVYSGIEYTVVPITPSFTYYLGTPYYLNPQTGTVWGTADVNEIQVGLEITT